jgi:hypothetical protein
MRILACSKALYWAGVSLQATGVALVAQSPPLAGPTQGAAGVLFACTGLATVVLGFLSQRLDARRHDRDLEGQLERARKANEALRRRARGRRRGTRAAGPTGQDEVR